MEVVETLLGIMDGFDPFFDSTAAEETDEGRKRALAMIVRSKGNGGAAGRDAIATKVIDMIVTNMRAPKSVTSDELTNLMLGVLDTTPAEAERLMRRKILTDRLERLVNETADQVRLHPAKKTEDWGSHDIVFTRPFDDWDVTLGYFPDYIRHRVIYGQTGTSPLINKPLVVSVRYHKAEHHLAPRNGTGDRPGLVDFLKTAELDKLAKAYGLSYELPPLGTAIRGSTHSAKGGYKALIDSLENELLSTPYSAAKLVKEISSVVVFHEDPGLSFHLIVEFPKGRPDIGQSLTLVFGADFFKLTKQQWDEFKKTPPIAIAALEPLKN